MLPWKSSIFIIFSRQPLEKEKKRIFAQIIYTNNSIEIYRPNFYKITHPTTLNFLFLPFCEGMEKH